MLFGGDEWWFFGPRIEPGDLISATRLAFDYRVTNTRFWADVLQRGDTNYFNQRGEPVAIQRSTAVRFLVENAQRLGFMDTQSDSETHWTPEEVEAVEQERVDYYKTFYDHVRKTFADVETGEMTRRPIGPHHRPVVRDRVEVLHLHGVGRLQAGRARRQDRERRLAAGDVDRRREGQVRSRGGRRALRRRSQRHADGGGAA